MQRVDDLVDTPVSILFDRDAYKGRATPDRSIR
jgi:hypothetical protein